MEIRKFFADVQIDSSLGERQIRVIANSGRSDRVKDRLLASGCKFGNYLKSPIVLADHDPSSPIGNFYPEIKDGAVVGVITFAPAGISAKADEYCGLYKAGVMKSVSVGFRPIEYDVNSDGGYDYKQWELLELSCVAIGCDANAVVIGRSLHGKSGRVLSARNSAALAELERCLGKSTEAHDAACGLLEKADEHRQKARRHAAAIVASADNSDLHDGDDDSDSELAYGADRRKREIEVYARASSGEASATRRKREIEIARQRYLM